MPFKASDMKVTIGLKRVLRLILFGKYHIAGLYRIHIGKTRGCYLWIFLNKYGWIE